MRSSNSQKGDSNNHAMLDRKHYWWKPIEDALNGVNLKGIKCVCPKCNEIGIATTRWVKGPILKPVYILHIKWNKVRKVCQLNQEEADQIRGNIPVKEGDIKSLLQSKKGYVLFSGGRDSLATLIYLSEIDKKTKKKLTAIYVNTTAGLPENTRYVRKVCKYLKIKLEVVKPKVDYFTLAREWGIPSFKYRWCCRELKIKPIEEYFKKIKEPKVVFDGIRAAESNARRKYIPLWYHPSFKCLSVSPIFYWSGEQVTSIINSNGIPKTLLHSLPSSTECWCGAYKTETDFERLYEINKDMFHKLLKLEEQNKNGYTFIYKNAEKIPLKKLERRILKEKKHQKE